MRMGNFCKRKRLFLKEIRLNPVRSQHYVRLYVYAFAFQASVQRGVQQNNGSSVEAVRTGIFKRGTMSSPDARFLMESVEAACDMLRICTDRLHPSNVLQYLPWRFFLYFS